MPKLTMQEALGLTREKIARVREAYDHDAWRAVEIAAATCALCDYNKLHRDKLVLLPCTGCPYKQVYGESCCNHKAHLGVVSCWMYWPGPTSARQYLRTWLVWATEALDAIEEHTKEGE